MCARGRAGRTLTPSGRAPASPALALPRDAPSVASSRARGWGRRPLPDARSAVRLAAGLEFGRVPLARAPAFVRVGVRACQAADREARRALQWGCRPPAGPACPAAPPTPASCRPLPGRWQGRCRLLLRAIQKESTELRAEEVEMRVTSSSTEALDLTQHRGRRPIPTSLTALSLASASPPLGGRATPKLASRSAAQDLDRMGVMTLVSVLGQERRALPSLGSVLGAGGGAQPGSASSRDARRPGVSGPSHVLGLGRARVVSFIPCPSDEHRLPVSQRWPDLTFPGQLLSAVGGPARCLSS